MVLILTSPALAEEETSAPDSKIIKDPDAGKGPSYQEQYRRNEQGRETRKASPGGGLQTRDDIKRDRDYRKWQQKARTDKDRAKNANKARDYRKARGTYSRDMRRNRRPRPTD